MFVSSPHESGPALNVSVGLRRSAPSNPLDVSRHKTMNCLPSELPRGAEVIDEFSYSGKSIAACPLHQPRVSNPSPSLRIEQQLNALSVMTALMIDRLNDLLDVHYSCVCPDPDASTERS